MTERGDVLSVIEAAYRPTASMQEWLEAVTSAFLPAFGLGERGGILLYDARRPDWIEPLAQHALGLEPAFIAQLLDQPPASPQALRAGVHVYRTTTFTTLRRTWVPFMPGIARAMDRFKVADATFVNATDPTFCGALLGTISDGSSLAPRTLHLWGRIAAHVAAGLRLQQQLRALANPQDLVDTAEAIISPQCRIEHATGAARAEASRMALREGLVRIEAARRAQHDPVQAVELWTGLCAGRWSLVEHFEHDGRRFLLACRNDPRLASTRALTERERQVCTFAAMGRSNKLIAYSLGLSISSVGKHLARARRKLGGVSTLEALAGLIPAVDSAPEQPEKPSAN
jgi:DNA-binding CsgD family transcriptional regulator